MRDVNTSQAAVGLPLSFPRLPQIPSKRDAWWDRIAGGYAYLPTEGAGKSGELSSGERRKMGMAALTAQRKEVREERGGAHQQAEKQQVPLMESLPPQWRVHSPWDNHAGKMHVGPELPEAKDWVHPSMLSAFLERRKKGDQEEQVSLLEVQVGFLFAFASDHLHASLLPSHVTPIIVLIMCL